LYFNNSPWLLAVPELHMTAAIAAQLSEPGSQLQQICLSFWPS